MKRKPANDWGFKPVPFRDTRPGFTPKKFEDIKAKMIDALSEAVNKGARLDLAIMLAATADEGETPVLNIKEDADALRQYAKERIQAPYDWECTACREVQSFHWGGNGLPHPMWCKPCCDKINHRRIR